MSPRHARHILGLCNLVAGALVAWAPGLLMPGAAGLGSTSANLLGASLGVVLGAIGLGAWLVADASVRGYLWLFGVGVKVAAAVIWGLAARRSGIDVLWSGAAIDTVVAVMIALSLRRER